MAVADVVQIEAYQKLNELVNGAMATQVVRAAAMMNLADAIGDDESDVEDLASRYDIPAPLMIRLLRALASLGVCAERSAGRFELTSLGSLLRQDRPDSANALVRMFTDPVMTGAWPRLESSVRTGRPAFDDVVGMSFFEYLGGKPELSALFNVAMGQTTRAVAEQLPDVYDFSRCTTVTDVGGGDGTVLTAVLRRNPGLRGVVFDGASEAVTQVEQLAGALGVSDRCTVITGDFFQTVPAGADLYLLKSVLHDWDDDRATTILRHTRAVLPAHGRVLIIEPVLPDVVAAGAQAWPYLLDLNMLVLLGGRERTRADFERLCTRSGLTITDVTPVSPEFSLIEAAPAG